NLLDGLSNGSIWALVAIGYTLVYGIIELINFAHGDNFMLGTFETKTIVQDGQFQVPLYPLTWELFIPLGTATVAASSGWHRAYAIAMAVFFSMLLCMVINVSIERIAYKPLRNQPRLAPLITAIGFSFLLQNVGLVWKDAGPQPVPDILPEGDIFAFSGITYSWKDFIVLAITAPLLIALSWLVAATKQGKAMRATAQDRDASAMMGINVDRTISFTFALGGALAGAAGAIYALYIGTTKFDLGFRLGLFAFTAAVLGGIGNLTGAVLGGVLLGMIAAYNEGFADARWTTTIIFSILVLILVFRPSGLLGARPPEGQ
ncbi:MAG TPA: branched-chain amino acid ABC transporter permease, partial [Actinomycetota bacterium]|nr:branched-chain amino acid ABC transporter permease [Actinomycetota bacterium]